MREFLHVDDLAEGVVFSLDQNHEFEHVNCGAAEDHTIKAIAEQLGKIVGFGGRLVFDSTKPDGAPRKILDSTRLRSLGWRPSITPSMA